MTLDVQVCYRALRARDARFDGRFFTAVHTTGIYCRPICPARTPREENVTFYPSAAAAQAAGFRPCLRCRPECSPQGGAWRGTSATVERALALIEAGALDEAPVDALAERLGVGERQLRRLFDAHLGASPVAVAQARRVHLAKQLIHETPLSMTEVALAAGFSSVRRFNEAFLAMFGRAPSALRRAGPQPRTPEPGVRLTLAYRPPYDLEALLSFLAARAIPGVEVVSAGTYARTFELRGAIGHLEVTRAPQGNLLHAVIRTPRVTGIAPALARVRHLFDLDAEPQAIAAHLSSDPVLGPRVRARPGLRVPGAWDGFELGVRAILGQQITVRAATDLAGRLVRAFGAPLEAPLGPLTHLFPTPARLVDADVAALGMPRARAAAVRALAAAAVADPHLFDPHRAHARLVQLPGIGDWTAQYVAMRAARDADAFPASDVGLQRALQSAAGRPSARALLARAEAWRPWRAYAALHLWTQDQETP